MTESKQPTDSREHRLQQLLEQIERQQRAGQTFDPETICSTHADLMPELEDELRKLAAEQTGSSGYLATELISGTPTALDSSAFDASAYEPPEPIPWRVVI